MASSYLTDRTQSVQFTGQSISSRHVKYGVPRGSVLGTVLFNIYTGDVGHIMETHGLQHHCYADDTQLYFCRPGDIAILKAAVIACIEDVVRRTVSNRLQLSPSKTEFPWCTTTRRLQLGVFSLGGGHITASTSVRDLGDMSMTTHVNRLVSSSFYHSDLNHPSLCPPRVHGMINSFVISRVDYCNSLLCGLPSYQLSRVQSVLNPAARITSHHYCVTVCIDY